MLLFVTARQVVPAVGQSPAVEVQAPEAFELQRQIGRQVLTPDIWLQISPGRQSAAPVHAYLLVGPEGGWADDERAAAPHRVALGDHVLRAETAAIVAGALLAGLRSGLVRTP